MDELPIRDIEAIVLRRGATDVRVFGSRARGEARPDSDLDILVKAGPELGLLGLAAMTRELEELLGIRVQVVTEGALHPLLRGRILSEAKPLVA